MSAGRQIVEIPRAHREAASSRGQGGRFVRRGQTDTFKTARNARSGLLFELRASSRAGEGRSGEACHGGGGLDRD